MSAPLIRFYFDPISPYAWLASRQLERIERSGAIVQCEPVLFAGLLNAHGQKGPAEIEAKRRYTFTDVMREAARLGLPFRGPPGHPFNPLLALRMCRAVPQGDARRLLACAMMAACWERGESLSDGAALARLADQCGLDGQALLAAAATPAIKQALADETAAAIRAGVFGVPTFQIDQALFWGGDRIGAVLAYLDGQRIDQANLERFLALPASATRPGAA